MRASACGVSVPASRPRAAARKGVCFVIGSVLRQRGDSKCLRPDGMRAWRSEEHTSELQSLMRNSYDVFGLKKIQKEHTSQDGLASEDVAAARRHSYPQTR